MAHQVTWDDSNNDTESEAKKVNCPMALEDDNNEVSTSNNNSDSLDKAYIDLFGKYKISRRLLKSLRAECLNHEKELDFKNNDHAKNIENIKSKYVYI